MYVLHFDPSCFRVFFYLDSAVYFRPSAVNSLRQKMNEKSVISSHRIVSRLHTMTAELCCTWLVCSSMAMCVGITC